MNNVARIQEKLIEKKLDAVLIAGEKNQRFATGFPFTDGYVLIAQKRAWLITDSRYIEAAQQSVPDCVAVQMYDREHPAMSLIQAALHEAGIETLGAEEAELSHSRYLSLEKQLGMELQPAQSLFTELRACKTEDELKSMREAQAISERALKETLPIITPGMTEREVAAELVYRMLRHGSEGNSFDPIVVTGSKTSLPHGVPGDKIIQAGDFLTMDFGSLKDGYCSDMTRTVAVGSATDEMKNVYAIVLQAQLAGIAAARAGIPGSDIDGAARKLIADAGYGAYFGHGFGHSLGLDIHEDPRLAPTAKTPLPVGAVVSAEPGIYLPGRFGVRIEDVLVLREGGCEVITQAPKDLIIL